MARKRVSRWLERRGLMQRRRKDGRIFYRTKFIADNTLFLIKNPAGEWRASCDGRVSPWLPSAKTALAYATVEGWGRG